MAVITNTYQTTSAAGKQNRETLGNIIENMSPQETPLFSVIGTETLESVKPEWLQTSLATPDKDNAKLEGDQYTYAAINQPARVGNFTQITRKDGIVSKTQDKVSKAGPATDSARAKREKGIELRRDIEASMLSNNASVGGTTRKSGGLRAWLATNDLFGAGGSSGGYNAGTGVIDAATEGTQREFTKDLMDDALALAFASGGNPTIGMGSVYAKRVFSGFMSDPAIVPLRVMASPSEQAKLVGAADAYVSDWGTIDIIPNRVMTLVTGLARNFYFLDPAQLKKGWLRPIAEDPDVVPNADANPFVIICEWTLINRNEKAHAVVADIFGLTAST